MSQTREPAQTLEEPEENRKFLGRRFFAMKFPMELFRRIEKLAQDTHRTRSSVVYESCERYLKERGA